MSKISVHNVSKVFGPDPHSIVALLNGELSKAEIQNRTGHVVGLRNVSIEIEEGQIFVIMGLSGSGKSTLVRHFNRLIEPTAGSIEIDGRCMMTLDRVHLQQVRQTKISMVFQHFGLMPHRTVLQNVSYGMEVRGEPLRFREDIARNWIRRVGLHGYEESYPAKLSGGMKQRVGLARALATNPEILLMDEAFSALDPLIRRDMQSMLLGLQKELRKTVVFITHDLDEALAIGDRIAILSDGVLVQVDSPAGIALRPANEFVRRFVNDVNRGRALTIGAIMSKGRPQGSAGPGSTAVRVDDPLDAALARTVHSDEPVNVIDSDGTVCGTVTRTDIVSAITGKQGVQP